MLSRVNASSMRPCIPFTIDCAPSVIHSICFYVRLQSFYSIVLGSFDTTCDAKMRFGALRGKKISPQKYLSISRC